MRRAGPGRVRVVGVIATVVVALGALAGPAAASTSFASPAHRGGRGHVMPRRGASPALVQTATSPKQLTNYGGRVVAHAKVYVVKWGTSGTFFPEVTNGAAASFFGGVTNSPYFDWLKEYNTSSLTIGRGSYAGTITITPSAANDGGTIDDASNIEPELQAQIAAHNLPAPDADTIFFLYFRQSQVVTLGSANSVVDFCAYHNTIAASPVNVLYAVMPYQSGPGCGTQSAAWDNMNIVASHELIETVTDPDVGLATSYGPPLTWYNANYGEIGDICGGTSARVVGGDSNTYFVQQEWSNAERLCIATRVQTISAGDVTMAEGNTRTRNMKFAVTLSDPSTTTVTVQYRLADVTATGGASLTGSVDYNNRGGAVGTLTFTRSSSSGLTPVVKYVTVPVLGDSTAEPDETFTLTLSGATPPYTIARAQATGTILNDDGTSGLLLAAGDASISAGDVRTRVVTIPVTLSAPASTSITMHYATSGAGAGTAYKAASGTLTFAANTVYKPLNITVYPDSAPTPGETFTLTLSAVNGNGTTVQLWRSTGTGSILGSS